MTGGSTAPLASAANNWTTLSRRDRLEQHRRLFPLPALVDLPSNFCSTVRGRLVWRRNAGVRSERAGGRASLLFITALGRCSHHEAPAPEAASQQWEKLLRYN